MQKPTNKIFISYSRHDKDLVFPFVERLERELQEKCWIDLEGIESGSQFEDVIIHAIDGCEILLFMLSEKSLQSEWTKREVYYAEEEQKRIIPVVLDHKGLHGWFKFHFGKIDYIDIHSEERCEKLFTDLRAWLDMPRSADETGTHRQNMSPVGRSVTSDRPKTNGLLSGLFSEDFHPLINMGLALQMTMFVIIFIMLLWMLLFGCLAFYNHLELSHVVLLIIVFFSLYATIQLRTHKSFWLGIIAVLDFVGIYLLGVLSQYLYVNWDTISQLQTPVSMRYQMLYNLGKEMETWNFIGFHPYLFLFVLIHITLICLAFCLKKNGRSGWDQMT